MNESEEFEFRHRMEQEAAPPPVATAPAPMPRASIGDVIAGTPLARFAMGVASPLIGAAQLGAHVGDVANRAMGVQPVVSDWLDKNLNKYEAAKLRGMQASGTEGFDAMGLLGSLAPSAAIGKAVSTALPVAKTVLQRAGVSALQGGVAAATQPVTNTEGGFWSSKGMQTAVGAAMGGGLSLLTDAGSAIGRTVKQTIQPFTDKGRAAILRELQEAVLGNDPHLRKIAVDTLTRAQPGVGGVMPTAGEVLAGIDDPLLAAQFTGIMAHQKNVSRLPGISSLFQERVAEQEAARAQAMEHIAQTPAVLQHAMNARGIEAAQKYGTAVQQTVTPDAAFDLLMQRPSMQQAVKRAANLAQESGKTFDPTSVQSLHYMKMAMDDIIRDPKTFGIGASEAKAMGATQQAFIQWLGEQSPAYNEARTAYQAASLPINRMEVGQQLKKSLTNDLGTAERSGVFANAVENAPRTIKKATGQQMFDTLNDVLTPHEVQSVGHVADELARKDTFARLARQTQLSGSDAIPGKVGLPLPNLLSRPAMIANFALRHAGQVAENKIARLAADQYLNPNQFAAALEEVPMRYAPLMNAMRQRLPSMVGAAMGRVSQP